VYRYKDITKKEKPSNKEARREGKGVDAEASGRGPGGHPLHPLQISTRGLGKTRSHLSRKERLRLFGESGMLLRALSSFWNLLWVIYFRQHRTHHEGKEG